MTAILYGARGTSLAGSDLYVIDPATGAATSIGPIGYAVTGLAFDFTTGILYGATSNNSGGGTTRRRLITIDTATGAGTVVGPFTLPLSGNLFDLACDSAGNLYGYSTVSSQRLCSVNKATGLASVIGGNIPSGDIGGISFDSEDVLWGVPTGDSGDLWIIETATGHGSDAGSVSGYSTGTFDCAAFGPLDVLYVADNHFDVTPPNVDLASINIQDAVASLVGASVTGLDAIAWDTAPTPPVPAPRAWTAETNPFAPGGVTYDVCWSPQLHLFVAGGYSSDGSVSIATSPDGVAWTARPGPFDNGAVGCRAVIWVPELGASGLFVAAGQGDTGVATSPDGLVWTAQTTPITFGTAVTWSAEQGRLVMGGGSNVAAIAVATSSDGIMWTGQVTPWDTFATVLVGGACYAPSPIGLFVIAGEGPIPGPTRKVLMTSPDGAVWTEVSTPFDNAASNNAVYLPTLAIIAAVGYNDGQTLVLMTSPDGAVWTTVPTPLDGSGSSQGSGIAEADSGRIILVGANAFSAAVTIVESTDSMASWAINTSPFRGSSALGVCYSPELNLGVTVGQWA